VRIADAATRASVSMDTLGRLVFEVFQMTPRQLLMKKRIDKACQLLEETSRTITDVAAACGYADHSAFSRQFRAATHVTPAQYRASHLKVGASRR
jgi:AraC-like DNA-binding protein